MSLTADCELMKWNLTLYQDGLKKTPTTFKLHCVYGLPKQGTTGFLGGGNVIDIEGMWTIANGMASDPSAVVYHLEDSKSHKMISFLRLNESVLHLLDDDQHLMIGTAAWSYTLNRSGN
jgi:NlpE N-terminal domain